MATTMDFEAYLNTNAPAGERRTLLAQLLENEDAAGGEHAGALPTATKKRRNRRPTAPRGPARAASTCGRGRTGACRVRLQLAGAVLRPGGRGHPSAATGQGR